MRSFFRISGGSNQHRGVTPDIIFPTALYDKDYGERVLDNALPWDEVKPVRFIPTNAPVESFSRVRELHEKRIKNNRLIRLLLKEIEAVQVVENLKTVSLQESTRRAEREKRRLASTDLHNEFREAAGLEPVPADTTGLEDNDELEDIDPLLDETARILFDLVAPARQVADRYPGTAKTAGITKRTGGTIQ